ncbi:MAG: 4-alpha-glucanotransferase [Clostridia bacterium]|nr:4-alpha-glucanotransferase [Clostridia bacterium]
MKRQSGVLMHVSSLWGGYSEGSFGTPAKEFCDLIAAGGFSVWQVLPFCLTDDCNSPYKSAGAFSINPNFIDLPNLYRKGLLTREELDAAKEKTPYACEFERLSKERFALLQKASGRLRDRSAIEAFLKLHPKVAEFCLFMAKKEANSGLAWTEWTTDSYDNDVLLAWQFTQYEAYTEWMEVKAYANRCGISIIGDLPIYVAYDSADVYFHKQDFQLDERDRPTSVAGVPPDYFSEDGQLWGNPLYDWEAQKKTGYTFWKDRLSFQLELFDGVRIDHFRGLESYYSVPSSETTAKNGKWIKGPGMDLLKALSPLTKGKLMIAEDLGNITKEVLELVKKSGYPGMRVLQFAFLGDKNSPHLPHNYDNDCVAYTGTHDNNTLLGYVWEIDPNTRARLLRYCGFSGDDWNAGYNEILRTMFESHAGLLILPVQDLLLYGRDTRLNTPGEKDGNWSFRLTKEQALSIPLSKFSEWNDLYGRK